MKLFLIDGHALVFKVYYAFLRRPMVNSKGIDTSIIFGFTKTILELLRKEEPTHFAVAFDPPAKTFRHEFYPEYKATRPAAPELVRNSLNPLAEILRALNIPVLMKEGFEADDVIGYYARKAEADGMDVYMYTPDKDYGQLISDHIYQYRPPKSGNEGTVIGKKEICEKYCISDPSQFTDILAIWGDASDNVPGIPGIGEIGATRLISVYGSIENIYASLDRLTEKQRKAFSENRDRLMASRYLVKIRTDIDMPYSEEMLRRRLPSRKILELTSMYEIRSVEKMLPNGFEDMRAVTSSEVPSAISGSFHGTDSAETSGGHDGTEESRMHGEGTLHAENGRASSTGSVDMPTAPERIRIDMTYRETDAGTFAEEVRKNPEKTVSLHLMCSTDNGIDSEIDGIVMYMPGILFRHCGNTIPEETRDILSSSNMSFAGNNMKLAVNLLRRRGVEMTGTVLDTGLMHYLLNPERSHSAEQLCRTYLEHDGSSEETSQGDLFSSAPDMLRTEAAKCIEQYHLAGILRKELSENGLENLYFNMEMPLLYVLADMEFNGVRLDSASLREQSEEMELKLELIEKEARMLADTPDLNLSSTKQTGTVIYEKLKLNPNVKKNRNSNYPTDEETLAALRDKHRFIDKLLEYREYKKLLSTYINPLPKLVSRFSGKIHTTFNQSTTATGRLSSVKPNLQNIPVRTETGREIRKNFISGFDGGYIVSADYSQIELRLMAHMSGDGNMIDDFLKGKDIHTATASRIFGIPETEITREQRGKAKTANFGIIYGISAFGLAQRLGIGRNEAKDLIQYYFDAYPGVRKYIDEAVAHAREKGYVSTIYGRNRFLPDINSRNAVVRGLAERNAVNAPIQGSAADIIKLAMIELYTEMKVRKMRSRMILQVHDELIFDTAPEELETLTGLVKDRMQNVVSLKVPLTVDCGYGRNWLEAH